MRFLMYYCVVFAAVAIAAAIPVNLVTAPQSLHDVDVQSHENIGSREARQFGHGGYYDHHPGHHHDYDHHDHHYDHHHGHHHGHYHDHPHGHYHDHPHVHHHGGYPGYGVYPGGYGGYGANGGGFGVTGGFGGGFYG